MLMVLCMAVARLRLTVMKRQVTTVSSKMGATRNVVDWRVVTAAYVLHCHLLLRPERRYRQLPASPRQETARKIATKRRDEHLESGLIPRSLPRESGKSTTLHIIHIVHGADIAEEAEVLRDLTEGGQTLTESSARDECPPSVWTIASSARRTWAQMVQQSRR